MNANKKLTRNIKIRPLFNPGLNNILAFAECLVGILKIRQLEIRKNHQGIFLVWPHSHLHKNKLHFFYPINDRVKDQIEKEILIAFARRIDIKKLTLERSIRSARKDKKMMLNHRQGTYRK